MVYRQRCGWSHRPGILIGLPWSRVLLAAWFSTAKDGEGVVLNDEAEDVLLTHDLLGAQYLSFIFFVSY